MRVKWFPVLAATLLAQGCVNHSELAVQAVESTVLHTNEMSYRGLESYPGKVVCGEYSTSRRARDNSYRPFIYRSTVVDVHPSREDITIFCSEDPALSLYELSGINFTGEFKKSLLQIQTDYAQLGLALEQYEVDNFRLPKTQQGLQALLTASEFSPRPRRFREGGYLDELPLDPWEKPYAYTGPGLGGVKGSYTLVTLGEDGEEGGIDNNADVSSTHMKYFTHLESL